MNRALQKSNSSNEVQIRKFPSLSKAQRAERAAAIKRFNLTFNQMAVAVRREFVGLGNWKQLSKSKASVVSKITAAIQSLNSTSDDILNKATRTVIQEIYAMEEWPASKRVVLTRATAAIRRLKLGT